MRSNNECCLGKNVNVTFLLFLSLLTVSFIYMFQLKKEFTSDAESAVASLRGLSGNKSSSRADLTLLFRAAAQEAKISRAQNRIFRVVSFILCKYSLL